MAVVVLRVGEAFTVRGVRVRVLAILGDAVRLAVEGPLGVKVVPGAVDRFDPDAEPPEPPRAA